MPTPMRFALRVQGRAFQAVSTAGSRASPLHDLATVKVPAACWAHRSDLGNTHGLQVWIALFRSCSGRAKCCREVDEPDGLRAWDKTARCRGIHSCQQALTAALQLLIHGVR